MHSGFPQVLATHPKDFNIGCLLLQGSHQVRTMRIPGGLTSDEENPWIADGGWRMADCQNHYGRELET
jgi:hypothetical protein